MRKPDDLKAEWLTLCAERAMDPQLYTDTRETKRGTVYVVRGVHGHHESAESHEHALSLFVDSFRTRVEDLESTHALVQQWGDGFESVKVARRMCAAIAAKVAAENPGMPGAERDALVSAAIAAEGEKVVAEREAHTKAAKAAEATKEARRP